MGQVVTYKGATDGSRSDALEIAGITLVLDEPTAVSDDVVQALEAQGEHYKIVFGAEEGYSSLTVPQLEAKLTERNVEKPSGALKPDLIAALEAADAKEGD